MRNKVTFNVEYENLMDNKIIPLNVIKSEYIEGRLINHFENEIITLPPRFGVNDGLTLILILGLICLFFLGKSILLFSNPNVENNIAIIVISMIVLLLIAPVVWVSVYLWKRFIIVFDCNKKLLGFCNMRNKNTVDSGLGEVLGFEISKPKRNQYQITAIGSKDRCHIVRFHNKDHAEKMKSRLCQLLQVNYKLDV